MRVPVEEGVAAAEAAAVLPPRRRPGPVGTDLSVVRGCGGPCGHKLEAEASANEAVGGVLLLAQVEGEAGLG